MTTPKRTIVVSPAVQRNLDNARAFGWASRQAATPDLGDKVAADKVARSIHEEELLVMRERTLDAEYCRPHDDECGPACPHL